MALEMNDLMMLRGMDKEALSPYEQVKIGYMQSRKASGTAIGALATAVGGAVAAVGVGLYACAKASEARRTAAAENAGTAALLKQATDFALTQIREERSERIAGDVTLTNTVNDSVSGSQQGSLTAQQAAELSSIQSVQQNLFNQAIMGNLSENPQKVMLYSSPQPCGCPCSCNG